MESRISKIPALTNPNIKSFAKLPTESEIDYSFVELKLAFVNSRSMTCDAKKACDVRINKNMSKEWLFCGIVGFFVALIWQFGFLGPSVYIK